MDQLIRVWQDNKVTPRDGITKQFHENYQAGLRATDSIDRHGWLGMIAAHLTKKPFNTMAFARLAWYSTAFIYLACRNSTLSRFWEIS